MKQTRTLMGMHITVEIVDTQSVQADIDSIFTYFSSIDATFSTYKKQSEMSLINTGKLQRKNFSTDMKKILLLCQKTKQETNGYFDPIHSGIIDPSGIVKGWAIWQARKQLQKKGYKNFYIDAGGDIEAIGKNGNGESWTVGIQNPFDTKKIIKVVSISNKGIATSGTAIRGQHIYNPYAPEKKIEDIMSITVIGPTVYEADRFATAAFAMGKKGITFIENVNGCEGYMVDKNAMATYTSGFTNYVKRDGETNDAYMGGNSIFL